MKKLLLLVAVLLICIPVFAAKSDILGLVPTATSMDTGVLEVEVGAGDLSEIDNTLYFAAEVGAFEGFEAGFDVAKNEEDDFEFVFDAKYSYTYDEIGTLGLGVYNIADGARAIPYLVYGMTALEDEVNSCDITLGVQLVEGDIHGLAAFEYAADAFTFTGAADFGKNLSYAAEATYAVDIFTPYVGIAKAAGDVMEYSFGTTGDITEAFSFDLGAAIPENGNLTPYLSLTYSYQIF